MRFQLGLHRVNLHRSTTISVASAATFVLPFNVFTLIFLLACVFSVTTFTPSSRGLHPPKSQLNLSRI